VGGEVELEKVKEKRKKKSERERKSQDDCWSLVLGGAQSLTYIVDAPSVETINWFLRRQQHMPLL